MLEKLPFYFMENIPQSTCSRNISLFCNRRTLLVTYRKICFLENSSDKPFSKLMLYLNRNSWQQQNNDSCT